VAHIPAPTGSAPYPLAQLGDDFDDGQVNTSRWTTNTSGSGTETADGRLRIAINPGVDTNFTSVRQWTLASSKVTAKLCAVPALNGSSNCAASMWVLSTTSGTRIGWRYDASTGVLAAMSQTGFADGTPTNLTYNAIDHAWLRVREASGTVYWETSNDGAFWTTRRTLVTPAWVTSQQVALDFPTTRTGGTSGYIEWDLVGAEVKPRFWGVVNEFPVTWEGLASYVKVTCTDLFKWLNRRPILKSMLAEEILHTSVASVFTPASSTQGKYLVGDLGSQFEATGASYAKVVEFWVKTTTTSRAILGMYETGLDHQYVMALSASGELTIEHTASGGALTVYNSLRVINDGEWHHILHDEYGSKRLWIDGAAAPFTTSVVDTPSLRTLHVGGYRGARMFDGQIAHLAITHVTGNIGSTVSPDRYAAGSAGFAGEDADARIERFARYTDLTSVTIWGTTHDAIASQGPGGSAVLARMREVESTESGRLFAERDYYGIAYQSRDVRYNPDPSSEVFVIDYADLETRDVELADDDQKLVNVVEASRPGGATQRVTAPSSMAVFGTYDPGALNILKTSDLSVLDAAAWRVSRYANPPVELREVPIEAYTLSIYLDILDADISSYFSVEDLPSQAPASSLRVTVEGYTETIKEASHLIKFHTSSGFTDTVWVLDDATYSVLDSTTRLAY